MRSIHKHKQINVLSLWVNYMSSTGCGECTILDMLKKQEQR